MEAMYQVVWQMTGESNSIAACSGQTTADRTFKLHTSSVQGSSTFLTKTNNSINIY